MAGGMDAFVGHLGLWHNKSCYIRPTERRRRRENWVVAGVRMGLMSGVGGDGAEGREKRSDSSGGAGGKSEARRVRGLG